MAGIAVALFDLDDTLFAHSRAVASGVTAHRRAHGGAMADADDASEAARWNELEEHHYHRYLAGELTVWEQRRARARGFVEPYGLDLTDDAVADEWWDRYSVEYKKAWELYDDTLPALTALTPRRLGIITNGVLEFQLAKLHAMAITDRFEHVVASSEVGAVKPDPRIFEHTAAIFGVRPQEAVYVGDRLHTDAIGAANAGMRGIWIDRAGAASAEQLDEASRHGVSVIRGLDELVALIAVT